jgi:hypothetical protein
MKKANTKPTTPKANFMTSLCSSPLRLGNLRRTKTWISSAPPTISTTRLSSSSQDGRWLTSHWLTVEAFLRETYSATPRMPSPERKGSPACELVRCWTFPSCRVHFLRTISSCSRGEDAKMAPSRVCGQPAVSAAKVRRVLRAIAGRGFRSHRGSVELHARVVPRDRLRSGRHGGDKGRTGTCGRNPSSPPHSRDALIELCRVLDPRCCT